MQCPRLKLGGDVFCEAGRWGDEARFYVVKRCHFRLVFDFLCFLRGIFNLFFYFCINWEKVILDAEIA